MQRVNYVSQENDLYQHIDAVEGALDIVEQRRQSMHDVLVNYKRDQLTEHKVQSGVISRELEHLTLQREAVQDERDRVLQEITQKEEDVRRVEESIRLHSRTSAVTDGRINVAHSKKKRRLDDELDALLEVLSPAVNSSALWKRSCKKSRISVEKGRQSKES